MNNTADYGFIVGINEGPYLGEGWHNRQLREPDNTPFRAVTPRATFRLSLPAGHPMRIKILMNAPVCYMGGAYRGRLLVDGLPLGEIILANDNWVLREFDLPAQEAPHDALFTIESTASFIPAKALGNDDFRCISCNIGAVIAQVP